MAKEKFVRTKPHVNIGSFFKKKLGFSSKQAEEPPIEPLMDADAPDGETSAGWASVQGLGASPDVSEYRSGEEAPAAFNPTELTVDKAVAWNDDDAIDEQGRYKVKLPFDQAEEGQTEGGGQGDSSPGGGSTNELRMGDSGGAQEAPPVPTPYPNVATQPGAGQDEDSSASHEYVVQRNESDLVFQTEPAKGGGDPDQPVITGQVPADDRPDGSAAASEVKEGGLNAATHKSVGPSAGGSSGDGSEEDQPVVADEGESQAAEQWRTNAFEVEIGNMPSVSPEAGDEVLVGLESGDTERPVVVGSLWSGDDAPPEDDEPSVLQDLEATGEMVPLEGGRMPDVASVDLEDVDLDSED